MESKKISIIMGVYNCDDTLEQAIESIVNQSYSNWELIMCDDCSTDNTYEILKQYKNIYPNKIIILSNEENFKLAYSLNKCLDNSSGYYIARMDGDDISLPDRFEKQVLFLEENQRCDLVGSSMQRFDENNMADIVCAHKNPDKYTLRNKVPFNHATIMTYKYVYDKLDGYTVSKRTERSQDHDLWFRFFYKGFKGDNIIEPLYLVRENKNAIKRRTNKVRINSYKTTLIGYKLLEYPLHWYLRPTILMLFKLIIPSQAMLIYRKYQGNKFNNESKEI